MKRNVDLLRRILLTIEAAPQTGQADPFALLPPGVLNRHTEWLHEARLLTDDAGPARLTWAACEFLDLARDDRRWEAAKAHVLARTGGLCFGAIRHALRAMGPDEVAGKTSTGHREVQGSGRRSHVR